MEYLDLTEYAYAESVLPMKAVGWLGTEHGIQGGTAAPLASAELRLLNAASTRGRRLMLGRHRCEFCQLDESSGEFSYYLPSGDIHAAPTMILHYAEKHSYRPPAELLDNLAESMRPQWDWRAEYLCALLLDESADFGARAEAVIDLSLWRDRRAFDALWSAMDDEEMVDLAGDELGHSLATSAGEPYAGGLTDSRLHHRVRLGIGYGLK
ncbi:hypothetical protein [Actinoplanes sp. L3-i22]|uniref:DUF7919 family protein n=1 Tax=Actinoplanes sp. L3-i22 TaxID=2836373 RepID=UPI001C752BC4|nr:hypothetical protein [Actinoplanes sp. L3-i22]BCY08769.1 hypothetical protein L3i22_038570 [Actinoplanes sp. L3-i22]